MNWTSVVRGLLTGFALVVLAGGAAVMVDSSLSSVVPVGLVAAGIVALLAFILALWIARQRNTDGMNHTTVTDPELPLFTPAPGADIDDMLYRLTALRQGTLKYRENIKERLGEAAIAVISHRDDLTREQAAAQLQDGSWTEKPYASAFFTEKTRAPSQSLFAKLFGSERSPYAQVVEQTVDAIIEKAALAETAEPNAPAQTQRSLGGRLSAILSGDTDDDDALGSRRRKSPAEATREDGELVADGVRYWGLYQTNHWKGIMGFALAAAAVGIFMYQPGILLASAVGVGLAAYARAGSPPPVANLDVTRQLSDESPAPGDTVDVTVTVSNEGDSFFPDLRLIDRVPGTMRVVGESPRMATALRAGDSATFSYTLVAGRGEHSWPVQVLGRNSSGAIEREATIDADTVMNAVPRLKTTATTPTRSQTSVLAGQVNTDIGGSGLEFYSVREYRPGDPMKRINWKRHAKTGELATIDFRQERAAQVVLLFDSRKSAYVSPEADAAHAVDHSVDAAGEVFASLFDDGNLVGVAAFDTVPCWLSPGAGDDHEERARRLFSEHPAISPLPPELTDADGQYVDPMTHVRRQLPANAQIMLFSPLCDDYAAEVARRLNSLGHLVTVVSADPTNDRTLGERLARVERAMRVNFLREQGIRVVDWDTEETLGLELERARQRWTA